MNLKPKIIEAKAAVQIKPLSERQENALRWARVARLLTLGQYDEYPQTAVTDLLADIRHYCEKMGVNYGVADSSALRHYQAESAKAAALNKRLAKQA